MRIIEKNIMDTTFKKEQSTKSIRTQFVLNACFRSEILLDDMHLDFDGALRFAQTAYNVAKLLNDKKLIKYAEEHILDIQIKKNKLNETNKCQYKT